LYSNNSILFIGHSITHYANSFSTALSTLGFNIIEPKKLIYHYPKPWEKLCGKEKYNKVFLAKQNAINIATVLKAKPKFVFIVNHRWVDESFFAACKEEEIPVYGYLMDSVRWFGFALKHAHLYTSLYSYEPSDQQIALPNGKRIHYLPLGFNPNIFNTSSIPKTKKWDLCFVGTLDKRRLCLLERAAKYAFEHKLKMVVYTSIQLKKIPHLWLAPKILVRRLTFSCKYPHLYRCIINKPINADQLAALYKTTKICLNITQGRHNGMHTGPNPRTFEIPACGAFQLLDNGHLYGTAIINEKHLVEFTDEDDLCAKIGKYINNNALREKISKQGCNVVNENYTINAIVKNILENEHLL